METLTWCGDCKHCQQHSSCLQGAAAAALAPEQRCALTLSTNQCLQVEPCRQQEKHARGSCPYAHPGDVAQRRPPGTYQALLCPEVRAVRPAVAAEGAGHAVKSNSDCMRVKQSWPLLCCTLGCRHVRQWARKVCSRQCEQVPVQ